MNIKRTTLCFLLLVCNTTVLFGAVVSNAPATRANSNLPSEDLGSVVRKLKTSVSDLRNSVSNHESEIRTFEAKLQTQENAIEHMHQQITEDLNVQRDLSRSSFVTLEGKLETVNLTSKNLETLFRGVVTDLRTLKAQANDSVAVLAMYRQELTSLTDVIENYNQRLLNVDAAIKLIVETMEAMALKEEMKQSALIFADRRDCHKVQSGDTLQKIASKYRVSLQALRDANQLTDDRIFINQTLKIP